MKAGQLRVGERARQRADGIAQVFHHAGQMLRRKFHRGKIVRNGLGGADVRKQRRRLFAGYQINRDVLGAAASDAMVLHCLPAHKGEEITQDVFDAHTDEIFEEAENRLHAQKAVMVRLMKNKA